MTGCGGSPSVSDNVYYYTTGSITADCTVTATFISENTGGGGTGDCPTATTGTPWDFPCEYSVAKAYNAVFLTAIGGGVPYDETSKEGLANLLADHESPLPTSQWRAATTVTDPLTDVTNATILVADTSKVPTFGIKVGTILIPIYTAGPWIPPTRGWVNDPMGAPILSDDNQVIRDWSTGVANIPELLKKNNLPEDSMFDFYVSYPGEDPIIMDSSNTHRIENNGGINGGFLLAFEDGGNGDDDFNEPIVYVNAPNSAPGGCFGKPATMYGTQHADLLMGTLGNDVIMAFGGNDTVFASLGDDVICGGDGNDVVFGGGGNDIIFDDVGQNLLNGEGGKDTIYGGRNKDVIIGGPGDDHLYGGGGGDTVYGDSGNDVIFAGGSNDTILGMGGNDIIHGGDGNDTILGVVGNNTLYGEGGDDRIFGGAGNNTIDGGDGINYCAPPLPNTTSTFVNCQ